MQVIIYNFLRDHHDKIDIRLHFIIMFLHLIYYIYIVDDEHHVPPTVSSI